jgi:hypothetical protein
MTVVVAVGWQICRAWRLSVQDAAADATVASGFHRPVHHPTTKIPVYR